MSMHPTRNLFKEFPNKVFVETGSFRGDGIQLALDAGFEKIISIDNDQECIDFCKNRFDLIRNPTDRIQLVLGDSATCLLDVIQDIKAPITFWLDSHWQMLDGTNRGSTPFPLMHELRAIRLYGAQRNNTIIIDDFLYMSHPDVTGWSKEMIEDELLNINPAYKLKYFANPVINNILVAHV